MSKEESFFKLDMNAKTIEGKLGYPLEIPINFKDEKLATIKINIELNKKAKLTKTERASYYVMSANELSRFAIYLKKGIELELNYFEREFDEKSKYRGLVSKFFWYTGLPINLFSYILMTDEDILERIKLEGPISFCTADIQERIQEWMTDNEIAGLYINKLRDSLLEYALGSKDKLLPLGRAQKDILRKFEKKWIKQLYNEFVAIFKIAKDSKEVHDPNDIGSIIDLSYQTHLTFLIQELEDKKDSKEAKAKIKVIKHILNEPIFLVFPNPLTLCIEEDEDLKAHFNSFRWEPNKLAKEILAKLLGVSESTIISILYRK